MRPKNTIGLPGIRVIRNVAREWDERSIRAAEDAANALLDTPIVDAWENGLTVRQFASRNGYEMKLHDISRNVFLALVGERISYREYRALMVYSPSEVSEACQMAMKEFFCWFESRAEMRGLAMGTGELLMLQMNPRIERLAALLDKPTLRSA